MEDVPWLYVAMIFIAFLSWVVNQVKEAAAIRRERMAERRRNAERTSQPEYRSPYREQRQSDAGRPAPTRERPRSFTDVFEEIERQFTEVAEPEEPEKPSPPPLPATEELPELPSTSPLAAGEIGSSTRSGRPRSSSRRQSDGTANVLRSTLRDGNRLQNALILNEILGPPRSRQPGPPRRR